MPLSTRVMAVPEMVAGAATLMPVVAPVIVPPRMRVSGLNDRTASF
jgi:hypothetical protein